MDRVKEWEDKEILTHSELNAEFDNITDNVESGADITDVANVAEVIHGATAKATPADNDELGLIDTAADNVLKQLTWTNVKATLKTYFDTLYNNYVHPNHSGDVTSVADGAQTIADEAVTLAKMADMATNSFIGRDTVTSGVPEILSKATALSILNVEDGADVTDATNVNSSGALMNSDYNANTFMYAVDDNTPVVKTRAEVMALLSGQAAADFAMNTHKITGVVDPTADQEAATKKYVDDNDHTQGTDTGLGTQASDINMGTHKLTALSVPSGAGHSLRATATITEAALETAITNDHAAGSDTALGAQAENLDMNTHKIVGVVDPTANQEAATKKYVDDNYAILGANADITSMSAVAKIDNAAGTLKIQPDVHGDVVLFGDTDVGNDSVGKSFYLYRKAVEGDSSFQIYHDSSGTTLLSASNQLNIHAQNYISIMPEADSDVHFFKNSNVGENRFIYQSGYITAASTKKYIHWQVNDSTDNFELSRQDSNIDNFSIKMPVLIDGNIDISEGVRLGTDTLTANNQNDALFFAAAGSNTVAQSGAYSNKVKIFGGLGQTRNLQLWQEEGGSAHIDSAWTGNKLYIEIFTHTLINGSVGIGTTTPGGKCCINGGLTVGSDTNAGDNNLRVEGTVDIIGQLDMNTQKIVGVVDPTANQEAATKKYVDDNSGGSLTWAVISANTNAATGYGYFINASGGNITLTLPASPSTGNMIGVCDFYNKATTNTITVARNTKNIEGAAENLVININGAGFTMVYSDTTRGWEIVTEI